MKKIISLILAIICAASTVVMMQGCDFSDTVKDTVPDETTVQDKDEVTTKADKEPEKEKPYSLPREYEPVIENYKKIVEMRLSEKFEENWNNGLYRNTYEGYYDDEIMGDFDIMITEMLPYADDITSSSYGYVLKDINEDEVPELFWVSSDLSTIFAVFTLSGMDVQLLDAFCSRYKCCVTDNGELYTLSSSGADVVSYHIRKLEPHSAELISVKEFGSDKEYIPGQEEKQFFYEAENYGADYIAEDRYEELLAEHPFENAESWKKSYVYSLPKDYYLTEMTEANIVSVSVPDVGADKVIYDRISSYLSEHFFDCQLTRTDSMSTEFFERFDKREYTEYCVEIDGTVTKSDDGIISIKFEGLVNYMTAANPNHILFTGNVDKTTGERVLFTDKYNINDELYDVFLSYAQEEIDRILEEESLSVEEQLCPEDSFLMGISDESSVCVYYSDESVIISYEVPFAVGGHREAQIPLSDLSGFLK